MKFRELSNAVAERCDLQRNVVAKVQEHTFRQIRAAVESGDRVQVPEFGVFLGREAEGQRTVRLKPAATQDARADSARKKSKAGKASEEDSSSRRSRKRGKDVSGGAEDDGWGVADPLGEKAEAE